MNRREDNIKADLKEIIEGVLIWIQMRLGWDRHRSFVNAVMKLHVPYNTWNSVSI